MPKKQATGGVTAAEVDSLLPRGFFVKRGDIQHAFGFTKEETAALIDNRTFVAEYPIKDGHARFVRTAVVSVAKRWEAAR